MIISKCTSCSNEHRLGERSYNGFMTVCPMCDSPSYHSTCEGEEVTVDERERIVNAVSPVSGVGNETAINLAMHFDLYAEIERASVDQLVAVDGVGTTVAQRIHEELQ